MSWAKVDMLATYSTKHRKQEAAGCISVSHPYKFAAQQMLMRAVLLAYGQPCSFAAVDALINICDVQPIEPLIHELHKLPAKDNTTMMTTRLSTDPSSKLFRITVCR